MATLLRKMFNIWAFIDNHHKSPFLWGTIHKVIDDRTYDIEFKTDKVAGAGEVEFHNEALLHRIDKNVDVEKIETTRRSTMRLELLRLLLFALLLLIFDACGCTFVVAAMMM